MRSVVGADCPRTRDGFFRALLFLCELAALGFAFAATFANFGVCAGARCVAVCPAADGVLECFTAAPAVQENTTKVAPSTAHRATVRDLRRFDGSFSMLLLAPATDSWVAPRRTSAQWQSPAPRDSPIL